MNVLSLFDGMRCGHIALDRAGIEVGTYYASEVDKYALQVAQENYPNTIQLGDINNWIDWDIDWPSIDLIIGGSPCQGFSFAGKKLNFNDERSKLFFEFVRILNETKPRYFLLENVVMKKEYQDIISKFLGVKPIQINSNLVSAQNRRRLYWTNIPFLFMPKDAGLTINDVLESPIKNANFATARRKIDKRRYLKKSEKAPCLTARYYKGCKSDGAPFVYFGNKKDGEEFDYSDFRMLTPVECERLQNVPDNFTDCVSNSQRYKMLGNGWTVDVIAHIFKGLTNARSAG
jgi:site-specific DNA-cytosine methylase